MDYKNNVFGRLLNGFSQFAHTLALGNPDISMSAKTGWEAEHGSKWFQFIEKIVDGTFYPLDGLGHCQKANQSDENEDYRIEVPYFTCIIISIIQVLVCAVLAPFFWSYYFIKKLY